MQYLVLNAMWGKGQNQPQSSHSLVRERETKLDQELEHKVVSNRNGESGDKTPEEFILNTWRSSQGRLSGGGGTGSVSQREESLEEETERGSEREEGHRGVRHSLDKG